MYVDTDPISLRASLDKKRNRDLYLFIENKDIYRQMSHAKLNQRFADSVRFEASKAMKHEYFDAEIKGFYLEVRKSGAKTWRLRLIDQDGKQRVLDLGDAACVSYAKARDVARSLRAASQLKQWELISAMTDKRSLGPKFSDFVNNQYLGYIRNRKRSYDTDISLLKNHLLPIFGDRPMASITRAELVAFHNEKKQTGYAAGTVDRLVILVRYIFNLAIRWGVLKKGQNPADEFELFNQPNGREKFLTEDELHRLTVALKSSDNQDLYHIVTGLLLTGCRKRELLDARWEHVNFELRVWSIPVTKQGKPHNLPITEDLATYFRSLRSYKTSEFLFPSKLTGMPYKSIFQSWHTARCAAGLPDLRMHDLRHTFASFLVNGGCSLYEVQRLLGHTTSKTTQRYAHLSQTRLSDAMNVASRQIAR